MPDIEFVLGVTRDTFEREVLPGVRVELLGTVTALRVAGGERTCITLDASARED